LLESGNDQLMELAEGGKAAKYKSTYLPHLEHGTQYAITPDYDSLKVTGRTGSNRPNIQNFPRRCMCPPSARCKGNCDGNMRRAFVPRPGFVFIDADYATLELRTLAQSCLDIVGYSRMAEALWEEHKTKGPDLHCRLAAAIYRTTPEEVFARYKAKDEQAAEQRTLAKAGNFGLPGGMGVDKFTLWAKTAYGLDIPHEQAVMLKRGYFEQWPEVKELHQYVAGLTAQDGEGQIYFPRSGRTHGGKWFTELCNLTFQGPAADGAKAAFAEVSRRCYTLKSSALYGSYPVAFIHDEILLESPTSRQDDARAELERVMIEEMQRVSTPDIPIEVEAKVMDRWSK
jgi:DNA polymerase-1